MGKLFKCMFLMVAMFTGGNALAADAHLMVTDAWIREAPPNATMLAGYFTIMNVSGKNKELVGATSDKFGKIELHKTVQEGGVAKMIAQPSVEVAKQSTVVFKPGGLHLMLMKPKAQLKAGDKVDITLKFSKGDDLKITAEVRKGNAMGEHQHEHMHMHMHDN